MDYNEFANRIKEKYPQYKNMDNRKLAQKMVEKYPQYSNVTFDEVKTQPSNTPSKKTYAPATYDDILNNNSLSREQKAAAIQKRGEAERKKLDFDKGLYNTKQWGGAALEIGSTLIPGANIIKGAKAATTLGKIGNAALKGAQQGTVFGFGEGLVNNENPIETSARGAGIGAGVGTTLPIAGRTVKAITSPKVVSALTSVPEKYINTALEAEKSGNSLFKGKWNPDAAYQEVGRKVREAKNLLPDSASYGQDYNKLGRKALEGMFKLKTNAENEISSALSKLNNRELQNGNIKNAVNTVINSFGEGGVYNPALEKSPKVMSLLGNLEKEGLTLRDLHRMKNELYDIGYQSAGAAEGTQAAVARKTAEQINNYLRRLSPEYAKANDTYSLITDVERSLPKDTTIAGNLSRYGSEANALNGMDAKLKTVNDLLPIEQQFLPETKRLVKSQNEIKNIQKQIGDKYVRNPKLLGNINDFEGQMALEDLQKMSATEFMPELERLRARDALEKWAPGQGGGSGSEQGFLNNVVRPALASGGRGLGAFFIGNTLGGPLGGFGALAAVSPKIMGQTYVRAAGSPFLQKLLRTEIKETPFVSRIMSGRLNEYLY